MFVGIGLITVPIAALIYGRVNHRKDRKIKAGNGAVCTDKQLRESGDRALHFRYIL
jgi:hypothetical protein